MNEIEQLMNERSERIDNVLANLFGLTCFEMYGSDDAAFYAAIGAVQVLPLGSPEHLMCWFLWNSSSDFGSGYIPECTDNIDLDLGDGR